MKMLVGGGWRDGAGSHAEVRSPYGGDVIDSVPMATPEDVEVALATAVAAAERMAALPAHRRSALLELAATLCAADIDTLASTITSETGKPIREARAEADRIPEIMKLAASEATRLWGDVISMDASQNGEGRIGLTALEPCGIVLAITPWNFPAILVMHKVAPALGAGNAVILKPASQTPLTALRLARYFVEAGFPPGALQCITGGPREVGEALCTDSRVRKISFTGSRAVGERISRIAGIKRLTCELGSNAAIVALDDADWGAVAQAVVSNGYANAGQVCISAQRVIVDARHADALAGAVSDAAARLVVGDPSDPQTMMGPLVSHSEATRVESWISEATSYSGCEVIQGGLRDGGFVEPTVIREPDLEAKVWREELFGPAVAIRSVKTTEEALATTNDTRYGLAVGVFTKDIDRAVEFARRLRCGVVHINNGPLWRTDFMPYGGMRDSGFGKEGVKYAMREMSEEKLVVVHPLSARS